MARDPGSVWAPLPEAGSHGSYAKNKMIYHSTGDRATAKAIRSYFSGATPNESTFIVGWGPHDPTLQIMDSSARADANAAANISGISVETVGTGEDPYSDWQLSELIRLGIWVHKVHGIPHQIIPTASGAGYGWHVMFGAPGPWTSAKGKVCPGAKRIQQLKTIVFPAIFAGEPIVQEDEMADPNVVRMITEIHNMGSALIGVAERPLQVEARLTPKIDALAEVVRQLAEKQGTPIDMAAIEAVVEKGVQDAIAGIETTVTVKTDA